MTCQIDPTKHHNIVHKDFVAMQANLNLLPQEPLNDIFNVASELNFSAFHASRVTLRREHG
jgi:hypothetical protein